MSGQVNSMEQSNKMIDFAISCKIDYYFLIIQTKLFLVGKLQMEMNPE